MASMTLAARAACPNPCGEIKKAILLGGESGSYRVVIDEVFGCACKTMLYQIKRLFIV